MNKILIYRFSAMGDVLMLLPVLKGILDSNKEVDVYLLTQENFFPFFEGMDRLHLISGDIKNKHRGFGGLLSLSRSIKSSVNPDIVVDLHRVIRTYVLDVFFFLFGFKVFLFKKGTLEKMVNIKLRKRRELSNTVERYAKIFRKIGLSFEMADPSLFQVYSGALPEHRFFSENKTIVGIAPFAKHRQKIWGFDKVDDLIHRINTSLSCNIILFGGGAELKLLKKLTDKYSNCFISADYFSLKDEIKVVHRLSVMISMDSANMHLGAMAGIPVVSVWGATHPSLGFAPYKQSEDNIIQYSGDLLTCRPCSVYGNRKCKFGDDIRCMNYVSVEDVSRRVFEIVANRQ